MIERSEHGISLVESNLTEKNLPRFSISPSLAVVRTMPRARDEGRHPISGRYLNPTATEFARP